jgi:hypothetical protein
MVKEVLEVGAAMVSGGSGSTITRVAEERRRKKEPRKELISGKADHGTPYGVVTR